MLKEIMVIFSLLMIASFADPFYEFKNSARGQVNGTVDNQNNSNQQAGKVFIPVEDLVTSKTSPRALNRISPAPRTAAPFAQATCSVRRGATTRWPLAS
jgi:hypothetical protein